MLKKANQLPDKYVHWTTSRWCKCCFCFSFYFINHDHKRNFSQDQRKPFYCVSCISWTPLSSHPEQIITSNRSVAASFATASTLMSGVLRATSTSLLSVYFCVAIGSSSSPMPMETIGNARVSATWHAGWKYVSRLIQLVFTISFYLQGLLHPFTAILPASGLHNDSRWSTGCAGHLPSRECWPRPWTLGKPWTFRLASWPATKLG